MLSGVNAASVGLPVSLMVRRVTVPADIASNVLIAPGPRDARNHVQYAVEVASSQDEDATAEAIVSNALNAEIAPTDVIIARQIALEVQIDAQMENVNAAPATLARIKQTRAQMENVNAEAGIRARTIKPVSAEFVNMLAAK